MYYMAAVDDVVIGIAFGLVGAAIFFLIMHLVIRSAVFDALRRWDQGRAPQPPPAGAFPVVPVAPPTTLRE
jgi:hypothetical protein